METKQNNKSLNYQVKRSFEIPLLSDEQYHHSQLQLIDSCTLIALDEQFQKLDIFSLCENKHLRTITFEQDGPNRIYPVNAFQYHNQDSIFLYSLDALSFQMINNEAEVMNSWNLNENFYPDSIANSLEGEVSLFYPAAITQNDLLNFPFYYNHEEKHLLFSLLTDTQEEGFNDRSIFYKLPPIAAYSITKDSYVKFVGDWPESYQQEMAPNNPIVHFHWNKDLDGVIVNYQNAPQLYNENSHTFYTVASNYLKGDHKLYDVVHGVEYSSEAEVDAIHRDEGYVNLVYNAQQQLYYRIVQHSKPEEEKSKRLEANWSIVVFNKEFQIMGEVIMPAKKYNFLQILPYKHGLLISKENSFSKTNQEEIYEFDYIQIEL